MSRLQVEATDDAILNRVLKPEQPALPAEAARAILLLDFPAADKGRMKALAAKARAGTLTSAEQGEIDAYGRVGSVLSILRSKARLSLKAASRGR